MRRLCFFSLLCLSPLFPLFLTPSAPAAPPEPASIPPLHQPAARDVTRYGPAYRYPQAGWVVLHIEGEPYERCVQHGRAWRGHDILPVSAQGADQSIHHHGRIIHRDGK